MSRVLGHEKIGTKHLLLGLILEGGGVAARVLEALGIIAEVLAIMTGLPADTITGEAEPDPPAPPFPPAPMTDDDREIWALS